MHKGKTGATKLKKAQLDIKGEAVMNAVRAAAGREGLRSFVFLFWENGDAKTGSATTSLQEIAPRSAVNLCLLGAEHAIQTDLKRARENGAPKEYVAIMEGYVAGLVELSRQANQALLDLNASMAKGKSPAPAARPVKEPEA